MDSLDFKGHRTRENLVRGIRLAWNASPIGFAATGALTMMTSVLAPILVWLGKHLVDLIVEGLQTGALTTADLLPTVLALGILGGGERALTLYRTHQQELFAWRVERHAMHRFLTQASSVDIGHLDNSDWHDRMARARRDVSWRPFQLTFATIGLGASSVTVIGMLGILASLHPVLVALSLVSVLPWVSIQRRVNRRIYEFHFTITAEDREKWYIADLLSGPDTAKELRAFGLGRHFLGRHDRIDRAHYTELAGLYGRANIYALISGLIAGAALAAAYGFVAARGLGNALTPGDLTAVIGAFAAVTTQVGLISSSLLNLDQHATFLDDYFSFLATERLVDVPRQPTVLTARLDGGIALENVHFSYPHGPKEALSGVDLHVHPGELVALVGENGAGKTTIVNMLLRFYDPDAGAVRVGGVDLRMADPAQLRARFGVLFQDYAKFNLSLRENVQLGRVEREAEDDEILAALETARADWLVSTMKQGLASKAGRLFAGGHELSGGEWQRLALARLIFRQADIWILDEPTSNLDPEAEAAIFGELKEQLKGRMGIVISHRFSTVRVADRIYVIQAGRVLESGTHDGLVARGGRYAELFEIQAAGYR